MAGSSLRRTVVAYARIHTKTALEYRANFIAQALFMLLNNALYLVLFYLLFAVFGTINGFEFRDVALVQGIAMFAIGLAHACFGGVTRISDIILEGKLDMFLSQPLSPLANIGLSHSVQNGWGDVTLGALIIAIIAPDRWMLALACALAGTVCFAAIEILIHCLAFVLPRPQSLIRNLRFGIIGFSSWPIDVYPQGIRAVVYLLGLAFIATVPRSIILGFGWAEFGFLALVAATLLLIAVTVFCLGLRRYESGNLIGMHG